MQLRAELAILLGIFDPKLDIFESELGIFGLKLATLEPELAILLDIFEPEHVILESELAILLGILESSFGRLSFFLH